MSPTLIIISGPTASGKTNLSIDIAKAFDAEIISADSRQFYQQLNIGTAKVSLEEQSIVKHHFIDHLLPDQNYNAGQFEADVIPFLDDYFLKSDVAVMVGGSGLYINAIKKGFDALPSTPPEIREKYSTLFKKNGLEHFQKLLSEKDPAYANEVDLNNYQRIQRALEAIEVTGEKFSSFRKRTKKTRPFKIVEIQLLPNRDELYDKINQRVDQMVSDGLLKEVESLIDYREANSMQTVGYKEILKYFDGEFSLDQAIDKIKQHTRNFAKRQFTWFKKHPGDIVYHEWDNQEVIKHLKDKVLV